MVVSTYTRLVRWSLKGGCLDELEGSRECSKVLVQWRICFSTMLYEYWETVLANLFSVYKLVEKQRLCFTIPLAVKPKWGVVHFQSQFFQNLFLLPTMKNSRISDSTISRLSNQIRLEPIRLSLTQWVKPEKILTH